MKKMPEDLAQKVYDLLKEKCGADARLQPEFVYYFCGPNPGNEFRFQGKLGFGGKFRFPRFTVDCYPEDETPERLEMIKEANKALAQLIA